MPPAAAQSGVGAAAQQPRPSLRDDKRRTLKSYWSNLAYNFLGVATSGNHEPLLVTAVLTAPAFAWDDEGTKYFAQHPHPDFGKIGSKLGGTIAVAGLTIGGFSAGRMSSGDRLRASTYDLSQAIIVNQVWTQALKFAIRRERPDGSNRVSFPSGHASNAFTAATVIVRHYPRLGGARLRRRHLRRGVAHGGEQAPLQRHLCRRGLRIRRGAAGHAAQQPRSRCPGGAAVTGLALVPDGGPSGDGAGARVVLSF